MINFITKKNKLLNHGLKIFLCFIILSSSCRRFDYSGISGGLQMFITTYSMVIYDFKDRVKKFMNIGKYLKVFVNK